MTHTQSYTAQSLAALETSHAELLNHLSELCRITGQFLDGNLVTFPVSTLFAAEAAVSRATTAKAKGGAA